MSRLLIPPLLLALPHQTDGEAHRRFLERAEENPRLELAARRHQASDSGYFTGHYRVFEDREAKSGREAFAED